MEQTADGKETKLICTSALTPKKGIAMLGLYSN